MATPWKAYGRYGTVGFELLASILIAFALGRWLDARFFPGRYYLTLIFFVGGVYTGFRAVYKAAKRLEADTERLDALERAAAKRKLEEELVEQKLRAVDRELDEKGEE